MSLIYTISTNIVFWGGLSELSWIRGSSPKSYILQWRICVHISQEMMIPILSRYNPQSCFNDTLSTRSNRPNLLESMKIILINVCYGDYNDTQKRVTTPMRFSTRAPTQIYDRSSCPYRYDNEQWVASIICNFVEKILYGSD